MVSSNGEIKRATLKLSPREREIVTQASGGATDKEIAENLGMSVATLRTYWVRLREKLGASNRTHAIALASLERPVALIDVRSRLVEAISRDRLATWVWQPRSRTVLLDDMGRQFFGLLQADASLEVGRLLNHIWSPDRMRFERFLLQCVDLRPMTPIELRVGTPGDYRNLVRTINLATATSPEPAIILATTSIHVFS